MARRRFDARQVLHPPTLIDSGNGGQEVAGVRMQRILEQLFRAGLLDDSPLECDRYAIAHVSNDSEVVRDEEQGQSELASQRFQENQDLGLHRDIERGDRFVEDQHVGLNGQGSRNTRSLTLTAAELVRQTIEVLRTEPYGIEQRDRPLPALAGIPNAMNGKHLGQGGTNRLPRIENTERILVHHLYSTGSSEPIPATKGREIGALEDDSTRIEGNQSHHGPRQGRLAATRLPDETERLASVQAQAHTLEGRHPGGVSGSAPAIAIRDGEIFEVEERLAVAHAEGSDTPGSQHRSLPPCTAPVSAVPAGAFPVGAVSVGAAPAGAVPTGASSSTGGSVLQRSIRNAQRGWNRHPVGHSEGRGTAPGIGVGVARGPERLGRAPSKARV